MSSQARRTAESAEIARRVAASGIPPALHDRMEVIDVPGYTRNDKLGIAREFLVPKQLSAHGLTDERLDFTPEGIACLVDNYTHEAGVRGLEREIMTNKHVGQATLSLSSPHEVDV